MKRSTKKKTVTKKKAPAKAKRLRQPKPEIAFCVQYIEVDFGQRNEGYALYLDATRCIDNTKASSDRGAGGGSYYGPARPLSYTEVPFNCLEVELQKRLQKDSVAHTDDSWSPRFRGKTIAIN